MLSRGRIPPALRRSRPGRSPNPPVRLATDIAARTVIRPLWQTGPPDGTGRPECTKKSGRLSRRVSRFPFRVIPLGFEPKTHSLEGCCSIQLSYGTIANRLKAISGCKINTNPPILQTLASYSDRTGSGGPQPAVSRSLRGGAGRRRASLLPPFVALRLPPQPAACRPLPQPVDFRRLPPAIRHPPQPVASPARDASGAGVPPGVFSGRRAPARRTVRRRGRRTSRIRRFFNELFCHPKYFAYICRLKSPKWVSVLLILIL